MAKPKLIKEIVNDVCKEIIRTDKDQNRSGLLNFMMGGHQLVDAACFWFSKQKFHDVKINLNHWEFDQSIYVAPDDNDDDYSADENDNQVSLTNMHFSNFPFIVPISLAVIPAVTHLDLHNPSPKCYQFLARFESLRSLHITGVDANGLKEILAQFKNLKIVDYLCIGAPGFKSSMFDLFTFEAINVRIYGFMFEAKPNCLIRPDFEILALYHTEQTPERPNLIMNAQKIDKYMELFPDLREFRCEFHHNVSERDFPALLKVIDHDLVSDIQAAVHIKFNMVSRYYHKDDVHRSTLFQYLDYYDLAKGFPYKHPIEIQHAAEKTSVTTEFHYENRAEYIPFIWNPRQVHFLEIPERLRSTLQISDLVDVIVYDPFDHEILFRAHASTKLEQIRRYFSRHARVPLQQCDMAYNNSLANLQMRIRDIDDLDEATIQIKFHETVLAP